MSEYVSDIVYLMQVSVRSGIFLVLVFLINIAAVAKGIYCIFKYVRKNNLLEKYGSEPRREQSTGIPFTLIVIAVVMDIWMVVGNYI